MLYPGFSIHRQPLSSASLIVGVALAVLVVASSRQPASAAALCGDNLKSCGGLTSYNRSNKDYGGLSITSTKSITTTMSTASSSLNRINKDYGGLSITSTKPLSTTISTVTGRALATSTATSKTTDYQTGGYPVRDTVGLQHKGLTLQKYFGYQFDGSPLRWEEIICPEQFVTSPDDQPDNPGVVQPTCLHQPPGFDFYNLNNPLLLGHVDTGSAVRFVLIPPVQPDSDASAWISSGHLPGNLKFDSYQGRLAIYTPINFGRIATLSSPARTETFVISVISSGQTYNFQVTLPVNLRIHTFYSRVFHYGQSVNITFGASGGPVSCASVPLVFRAQVACGPMVWSYTPTQGGPLPDGLTLSGLPNGSGHLAGTVQVGAYSSRGKLHLTQGTDNVQASIELLVPVYLSDADIATIGEVHEIERGQNVSFQLPQPLGGDGSTYTWRVEYGSPDRLPAGLGQQPVQHDGSWWVEGTVASDAPIGTSNVHLRVFSTMGPGITGILMPFNLSFPFNVLTQNSKLIDADLVPDAFLAALGGAAVHPVAAPVAAPLFTSAVAAELCYDSQVPNTTEDNTERTDGIIDLADRYDIVALQEVFTEDNLNQLRGGLSNYQFLPGPSDTPGEIDIDLFPPSVDITLPKGGSGLHTLVRKDLSPQGATQPLQAFEHQAVTFSACAGGLEAVCSDKSPNCLANKGFTFDKVQLGALSNEYVYVVNTHLDADQHAENMTARAAQLSQISSFVSANADPTHPVILLGDFNIVGDTSPEYGTLLGTLGAADLYRVVYMSDPGFTSDNQLNAYAYNWENGDDEVSQQRLDYILVLQGTEYEIEVDTLEMVGDDANEEIRTTLCHGDFFDGWLVDNATLRCHVSDHFGLSANLRLVKP